MKAWLLDSISGIENLRLADFPDPSPGPGEVLLDVIYAALNPADRYLAEGQYPARPTFPHILGRDGVGVVRAVGPGVTALTPGAHCTVLRGVVGVDRAGTFATKVVVRVESLVAVPEGWSLEEASCAALVYVTAHQALTQWGELPPSVVLVTGASGGVGVATVQLASALGHTVIGLSRGPSKVKTLTDLGAAAVFDPQDPSWRKQVKEFLRGKRVDLVVDNIGGALFPQLLDTLGEWGKVSVVGRLAGPVPEFNTAALFFRRLKIGGVAIGSYTNEESRAAWKVVVAALDRRGAKPLIDRVFPFEELPAAFARLKEGPMGKVLLRVG